MLRDFYAQCKDSQYFFVFVKILMEKLRNMWLSNYILDVPESAKTSPANKHEPLDSSHGAQIMAKEVGVVLLMFLNIMPYETTGCQVIRPSFI